MHRSIPFRSLVALSAVAAVAALFWLPTAPSEASGINAGLICEPGNSGAICEAVPANPSYSYAWSVTGNLTLSGGTIIQQVGCFGGGSGGTVTVTVTAPGIGSDSASRSVSCTGPGDNPPWLPPWF